MGTNHGTVAPASSTSTVEASMGRMPTRPVSPSATAPTTMAPAAITMGGRPVLSSAEITK